MWWPSETAVARAVRDEGPIRPLANCGGGIGVVLRFASGKVVGWVLMAAVVLHIMIYLRNGILWTSGVVKLYTTVPDNQLEALSQI